MTDHAARPAAQHINVLVVVLKLPRNSDKGLHIIRCMCKRSCCVAVSAVAIKVRDPSL
ncbi:hypothetical protein BAUCODRAFT_36140 [Baudoinia panamericana UAMH 10762]|uniref:Uncharacterized protein n=1 Tax=Baudoinia panamericana (strain UAMH 10762) TaxID=717646 RepID=M2N7T3_BAUPA|nr:uncharacterized protein BAUCODRAFT_36140 [Baudoinia panamericana UAMH 10762]EMC94865.1 hypothetical protein BAUCODRAFT_36140 [Baudoinia panamericana UAMH 10762]